MEASLDRCGARFVAPGDEEYPASLEDLADPPAMLFVRGEDPRAAVEAAAAAEDIDVVEWRTPPTDDAQLGDMARATRPRIVQAILSARNPNGHERAAYRLRSWAERGVNRTRCPGSRTEAAGGSWYLLPAWRKPQTSVGRRHSALPRLLWHCGRDLPRVTRDLPLDLRTKLRGFFA